MTLRITGITLKSQGIPRKRRGRTTASIPPMSSRTPGSTSSRGERGAPRRNNSMILTSLRSQRRVNQKRQSKTGISRNSPILLIIIAANWTQVWTRAAITRAKRKRRGWERHSIQRAPRIRNREDLHSLRDRLENMGAVTRKTLKIQGGIMEIKGHPDLNKKATQITRSDSPQRGRVQ